MRVSLKLDVSSQVWFGGTKQEYRYRLDRIWDQSLSARKVTWIMLNPSTADGEVDDPTVAKIQTYSRAWGYGRLSVVNLFAWRSPSPFALKRQADPVGPDNDDAIRGACHFADLVIAAWGNNGKHLNRAEAVRKLLLGSVSCGEVPPLHCLKINQNGEPAHPLYLKLSATPIPYAHSENS